MRLATIHLLPTVLLVSLSTAFELSGFLPFQPAVSNDTIPEDHDLLKRDGNCPNGFNSCSGIGVPQLCCASHAVCTVAANNVAACCPSGAVCTGTIGGVLTQGTVNSNGALVGGGGAVAGATTNVGGVVTASQSATSFQYYTPSPTTSGTVAATAGTNSNGFIVVASTVVATPAAGVRRAEVPLFVQAIVRVVQFLPL